MNISREDLFLVHALQHPHDDRWQQRAMQLRTPSLDWLSLFQRADAIGLGPMLYRQLSNVKEQLKLPDDGMEFLKNSYLRNLATNTYRGIELVRILNAFGDAGIAVILLKGAALAEGVYNDPGARVYGDLDILVKKADLERGHQLLRSLNYHANATASAQDSYRTHHHHLAPMIHQEKSVVVEL
ncbi:nucleotidyltransferase family protein, partial [Desulfosarcina sp.]|uniref:nucleotidyltransferase family protein n=1 Tax=Desulfosarcina sp. TaxID=2027861 RepID=UPI0035664F6D